MATKLHLPKRSADAFDTLCRRVVDDDHRLAIDGEYVNCGRCKAMEASTDRFVASRDHGYYVHKGSHADVLHNERLAEYRDDDIWENA